MPTADLVGTSWRLESLVDGNTASSVSDEPAPLLLAANGEVTGSTGCHDFRGTWQVSGATVDLDGFAIDESLCPPELRDQDEHVASALGDGFTVEISGDVLTVTGRFGAVLIYRKH